jgi:hypothetical protein
MGRLSNRDVDALVQMQYEDALADEEPWALDAFDARHPGERDEEATDA